MKFTLLASAFALAASVSATPSEIEKRSCLTFAEATTIVNKFKTVLENSTYNGQSTQVTADQVIAKDYTEYSDSILSLEKAPLGDTPSATSRKQWYTEVTAHPDTNIQTLDIISSCDQIVWYWLFPNVANGQYRVKGFNLFTVNSQCKIKQANIEFNSIAWGADDGQLYQWCPPPNSTTNGTSSS